MKYAVAALGLALLVSGLWVIAHPETGAAAPDPTAATRELRATETQLSPVVAGVALISGGALFLILAFRRR